MAEVTISGFEWGDWGKPG